MKDQDRLKICQMLIRKIEGTLTPEECAWLYQEMNSNQEVLDLYVDHAIVYSNLIKKGQFSFPADDAKGVDSCDLDNLLLELSKAEKSAEPIMIESVSQIKHELIQNVQRQHIERKVRKSTVLSFAISAAAVLFVIVFLYFAPSRSTQSIAKLTRTIDAQWRDSSGQIWDECELFAGPLHLAKGYAEICTDDGTEIILEAPVELELESASQLNLHRGRVTVKITQGGNQYVVRTPTASVVDFGTEFGVQVEEKQTLTHVYEGQVELRSGSNPLRVNEVLTLTKGQGGKSDSAGQLSMASKISNLFTRSEEFEIKHLAQNGSTYEKWIAYSYELRRDPDLVLYYPLLKSDAYQDSLSNYAEYTQVDHLDGTFGGTFGISNFTSPSWATGRWGAKSALNFDRDKRNCISLVAAPEFNLTGDITLAAWVKCSELQKGGHLFSNRTEEGVNYQFGVFAQDDPYYANQLQFLRSNESMSSKSYSRTQYNWSPEWTFFVVTHDRKTVHFYVNGQLFESAPLESDFEPVQGDLFIGDVPSIGGKTFGYAAFNGLIDEIALFKKVLSPQEIEQMYQIGKPE